MVGDVCGKMDMKIGLLSLSGMLVLSLLTSVTLAGNMDGADKYLDSEYGTVVSGVIKSQNNCPPGTAFFKNQAPNLSNNPNPGSTALTYTIDNTDITMNIEWSVDNSFQFSIENGVVHKLGRSGHVRGVAVRIREERLSAPRSRFSHSGHS